MFGSRNTPPKRSQYSGRSTSPTYKSSSLAPKSTKQSIHSDGYASQGTYNSHYYDEAHAPPPRQQSPELPEVLIAIMGATGSGKSTFINLVSGSNLEVGEGLKSCTSVVETVQTFRMFGRQVTLVDTPGFDDTTKSDTDILKMIAVYLSTTYQNGVKLSGLIYMHRISDVRVGGISRKNFSMFRKLCGDETLKNVVIVTNMWGEVALEKGMAREHELRTDDLLFKPVLDKGAEMLRHENTLSSAQAILMHLINNDPMTLRIQKELVDEGKDITQTDAGVELDRELAALMEKHKREMADIQEQMAEAIAEKDMETKKELEQVRQELENNMRQIETDRDRLSREYAQEKERADERMKEVMAALEVEKTERLERQKEIARLQDRLDNDAKASAEERERMRQMIKKLESRRSGGIFSAIGRGIDKLFGLH